MVIWFVLKLKCEKIMTNIRNVYKRKTSEIVKEYLLAIGIVLLFVWIGFTVYTNNQRVNAEIQDCRDHGKQAFVDRRNNVVCIAK